jgi:pyrimidine deaminase RibD-like protein
MNSINSNDSKYMKLALEQARLQASKYGCGNEKDRPDPLVGCVIVTTDGRMEAAYRGEIQKNDHAEFTVLEKKLHGVGLDGSTLYTTLEPCTSRGPEKISCADRIISAGVKKVFIGYMDPDDRGRGYQKLVESKIKVQLFNEEFVQEIIELNRPFIESRKKSSLSRIWFDEIELACNHKVKILADLDQAPRMNRIGTFHFPPNLISEYEKRMKENEKHNYGWNEKIAEYRGIREFGKVIDYEDYNYIQWKTLRETGNRPRAIYAGAILVCPEERSIFIHKRSKNVETEPGKLHGFLGGFIVDFNNQADDTLLHACLREVHEESSSQPNIDNSRVVIVENLDIGWIDVMFMAGVISSSNADRIKPSKEGEVIKLDFSQLEKELTENNQEWVSNGIAHHLIWLKLNAPGAPKWFQKEAQNMYKRITNRLHKS